MGLVASRSLAVGEVLLDDQEPLLSVGIWEALGGLTREDVVKNKFKELSLADKSTLLGLCDANRYTCGVKEDEADRAVSIFFSNSFNCGEVMVQLFPRISRLNHSCAPNCRVEGSQVISTRTVDEGEEVCFSYLAEEPLVDARRKMLFERWSFLCSCERCRQEESLVPPL